MAKLFVVYQEDSAWAEVDNIEDAFWQAHECLENRGDNVYVDMFQWKNKDIKRGSDMWGFYFEKWGETYMPTECEQIWIIWENILHFNSLGDFEKVRWLCENCYLTLKKHTNAH